jgi:dihydrodipicolinate synthase/N-acetylneuraminate lyase
VRAAGDAAAARKRLADLTSGLSGIASSLPEEHEKVGFLRKIAGLGDTTSMNALVKLHLADPNYSLVTPSEAAENYLELIRIGYLRPPTLKETWEWKAPNFQMEVLKKLPGYSSKRAGTFTRESLEELNKLYGSKARPPN